MKHASVIKPAVLAVGAAIAGSLAVTTVHAENALFSLVDTSQTASDISKGLTVLEGKCGEGKCGTLRIRVMMDLDSNGFISRNEYVTWAAAQADSEFDRIAGAHNQTSTPEEVFDRFKSMESPR